MARKELEPYISKKQVAEFFGVSEQFIETAIKSKGLPCYKPSGGLLRFRLSEVETWMQQRKKVG